jgi:hypothetical protein
VIDVLVFLLLMLVAWSRNAKVDISHISGARRLYPTLLPNNLFSIEEGCLHFDVEVEQDQPHDQEPEDDDEVEEQGGGPGKEAQPQNPYATYKDGNFIHRYPAQRARIWRVGYVHKFYGTDI